MVMTLIIPLRKIYGLEELIRPVHFEAMSKLILVTSGVVTYAYATEFYIAWFSNNTFERYQFWFRPFANLREPSTNRILLARTFSFFARKMRMHAGIVVE